MFPHVPLCGYSFLNLVWNLNWSYCCKVEWLQKCTSSTSLLMKQKLDYLMISENTIHKKKEIWVNIIREIHIAKFKLNGCTSSTSLLMEKKLGYLMIWEKTSHKKRKICLTESEKYSSQKERNMVERIREIHIAKSKLNGCKSAPQVFHIPQSCIKSLLMEQKLGYLMIWEIQLTKKREIWLAESEKYILPNSSWMVAKVHLKYFAFFRLLAPNHCWWRKSLVIEETWV